MFLDGFSGYSSVIEPEFADDISNITVSMGKEAVLQCIVYQLGSYKVKMQSQIYYISRWKEIHVGK